MHQNTYNHAESEPHYRRFMSNIAYKFKFKVVYEEDRVLKVEDGRETVLSSTLNTARNCLCWKAWLVLQDEYDYRG